MLALPLLLVFILKIATLVQLTESVFLRVVGAVEAKKELGQLLDLVERGEEIAITREGREVARLVPASPAHGRGVARAAVRRMRERAEQLKLGRFDWSEWKSYRDEGRQ